MKTVKLSSEGRLRLPRAIREKNNWKAGTEFVIIDSARNWSSDLPPATELESHDAPKVYRGKPLSLQEIEQAALYEAGKHR